MKANDFIQILNYMKTFETTKDKPKRNLKKKVSEDEVDLAEVYLKLNAREQRIKNAKEQIEKMLKKEEKKDDKKGWCQPDTLNQAIVLTTLGPFVGVLLAQLVLHSFK